MLTVMTNGRLLDCIGDEAQENSSVIIENGVIKDVYSGERAAPGGATVIDVGGRTVMPGLIDAHTHPAVTQVDPEKVRTEPPLYIALGMKNNLEQMLQAGFTTIRDMGGCHWSLKQAVEEGLINGPRLLIACSALSPTGGHGDVDRYGETLFHNDLRRLRNLFQVCDGEDGCRKAAREQYRAGADHIKIMATGGCASPSDEPWHQQFCEAEIRAIVEEAEAVGLYVGAHCQGDLGMRRAVQCGVRTIEHGPFMSEETAKMMKEKGAFLVPTLTVMWWFMQYGEGTGASEWLLRKIREPRGPGKPNSLEAMVDSIQLARKVGIPIGSGTDYFGAGYGGEAMELKLKTEGGMTPYEAIKSATVVNSEILRMEDKIGTIEIGKWADLIVIDGHPDEDINALVEPANVHLVMKKGEIAKNTF